jgi:hypothetical protein
MLLDATPAIRDALNAFELIHEDPAVDPDVFAARIEVVSIPLYELFRRRSPSPFMEMLLRVVDAKVRQELMRPEPRGFGQLVYGRTGPNQRPNRRDRSTIQSGFRKVVNANTSAAVWSSITFHTSEVYPDRNNVRWKWITRRDELVCSVCRPRDGVIYANFSDAPAWPAHPRCVVSDTLIRPGTVVSAYRARYGGALVTIGTQSGCKLTVTEKHPVLTSRGWVPAGQLQKGEHLVRNAPGLPGSLDLPDFDQPPARAEDVFNAVRSSSSVPTVHVPATAVQFHGDGVFCEGDVEVVFPQWVLKLCGDTERVEDMQKRVRVLAAADLSLVPAPCDVDLLLLAQNAATSGLMSLTDQCIAAFRGQLLPPEQHRVAATAWLNAPFLEPKGDHIPCDPEQLGECLDALPLLVTLDEVVHVEINTPTHPVWVYDFSTLSHTYIAGGMTTHNCRCVLLPLFRD